MARLVDNDTDVLYETFNPLVASRFEKQAGPKPVQGYRASMLPNKDTQLAFMRFAIEWYAYVGDKTYPIYPAAIAAPLSTRKCTALSTARC